MKLRKKVVLAGVVSVAALGIGTAAFAIIKANGSGQGTANVVTTVNDVDLTGELPPNTPISPDTPLAITVKAKNPNPFTATIGRISGTITGVDTGVVGVDNTVCKFEIVPEPAAATHAVQSLTPRDFVTLAGTEVFLLMRSSAADQTACLNASVTFDLTA